MKNLNDELPIIFLGDHHGAWNELFYLIDKNKIKDCHIISVGDLGIGFKSKKEYEYSLSEKLNNEFKEKNINFYGIRGNHDNPSYFKGENRICFENFEKGQKMRNLKRCHHEYHTKCIDQWLQNEKRCPVCNEDVL